MYKFYSAVIQIRNPFALNWFIAPSRGWGGINVAQELYARAGSRIRALRESRGYTREQLSEIAEISPKFLYEIEAGIKGFSAHTLCMLANGLNASCDYILYGNVEYDSKEEIDYILKQFPDEKTAEIVKIFNAICQLAIF